jgi:hypothetical protein
MTKPDPKQLEGTKTLMAALLRQRPKPHDAMKVGKKKKPRRKIKKKDGTT